MLKRLCAIAEACGLEFEDLRQAMNVDTEGRVCIGDEPRSQVTLRLTEMARLITAKTFRITQQQVANVLSSSLRHTFPNPRNKTLFR